MSRPRGPRPTVRERGAGRGRGAYGPRPPGCPPSHRRRRRRGRRGWSRWRMRRGPPGWRSGRCPPAGPPRGVCGVSQGSRWSPSRAEPLRNGISVTRGYASGTLGAAVRTAPPQWLPRRRNGSATPPSVRIAPGRGRAVPQQSRGNPTVRRRRRGCGATVRTNRSGPGPGGSAAEQGQPDGPATPPWLRRHRPYQSLRAGAGRFRSRAGATRRPGDAAVAATESRGGPAGPAARRADRRTAPWRTLLTASVSAPGLPVPLRSSAGSSPHARWTPAAGGPPGHPASGRCGRRSGGPGRPRSAARHAPAPPR
ncbi:hypothetical protein SANTM175S_06134 [Streptomyces antimycoticus]